jgi:hypothetical protein
MLALAQALGVPTWGAIGLIEALIHWTAKYAPGGNVGKWNDAVIAQGIGWSDDPVRLMGALVSCGWLDEHTEHRLLVHDWSEHADDAVHRSLARAHELFADGVVPNTNRLAPKEKDAADRAFAKVKRVRTPGARKAPERRTLGALPEPRQSPAPPEPEPRQSQASGEEDSGAVASLAPAADERTPGSIAWETGYAPAYERRYGAPPIRNAKTNALMAQLVKRIGADESPAVGAFYVGHNGALYVNSGHCLDLLVRDAEKLPTEMVTGRTVNAEQARRNEKTAANPFLEIAAEERRTAAAGGKP